MLKKKFTFDDPEDSYWNESGSNSSSLFDDAQSKQTEARAALDDLFDTHDSLSMLAITSQKATTSSNANGTSTTAVNFTSAPPQVRDRIVDDFISKRTNRPQEDVVPSIRRTSPPAPSIASECSSLPSEAVRLDLDFSRLRAEHRKLQRHLETVRHDRFRAPDVVETTRRLLRGDPVPLEFYRSKTEKLELLDEAIKTADTNVIQTVILFLKGSLSDSLFREILLQRKEAADEYIYYLKETREFDELVTTLFALGRNADAAMVEFGVAVRNKTPNIKVQALRKCCHSAFSDSQLSDEAAIVHNFVNLLERQIPIDSSDDQSKLELFKSFPKNTSLVGKSVLTTLYYCCLYHCDAPSSSLVNAASLRDSFAISEKEFVWTSIAAFVRLSRWPDIERALSPKSLMGVLQSRALMNSPKFSCPFSWTSLFVLLHSNMTQPPKDLLCRILRGVNDAEQRIKLAEKYKVTEIVIESLVAQKDRVKLAEFASRLQPHTPDAYKALAALNNSSIRWKN